MRRFSFSVRPVAVRALLGAVVLGGALVGMGARSAPVTAATPRVIIVDNDGGFTPGDPATGGWAFAPAHMAVVQGAQITFDNPSGNFRPHTVTSISTTGRFPNVTLDYGAKFNSSPTADDTIKPGQSWTLDTSTLDPGQYSFFCALHPWMVGSLTVMPAATPQ
jgi:plastocyanin